MAPPQSYIPVGNVMLDPALFEALFTEERKRHVLFEVDQFVHSFLSSSKATINYESSISYHRLLAHRVAQHYGLSTFVVKGLPQIVRLTRDPSLTQTDPSRSLSRIYQEGAHHQQPQQQQQQHGPSQGRGHGRGHPFTRVLRR